MVPLAWIMRDDPDASAGEAVAIVTTIAADDEINASVDQRAVVRLRKDLSMSVLR
jgi:hypothetical protein